MKKEASKELIASMLDLAGVKLDGTNPWDITVHDERLFTRLLKEGEIAFGESFMDGWWDCDRIDLLTEKIAKAEIYRNIRYNTRFILKAMLHFLFNPQTKRGSKRVALNHYDIGNDLYERMLDKSMSYSCGYWKFADNLDQAQGDKLEMICQKLQLKPGMKLLDIGCGWGGMAQHAAQNYGVEVVGVTISKEQKALAEMRCQGLPIDIRLCDYRDIREEFDRIVSIGMFEHVGQKNYDVFMEVAHQNLKDEGLFLLHTIGNNRSVFTGSPWILKYIFPNSMIPSIKQIGKSIENRFVMEDWHNFGPDYEKTLLAWHDNFQSHWDEIKHLYDERFKRMWSFYLLYCAGAFRARYLQLWQLVLSKGGVSGGYRIRELNKQ